MDGMSYAAFLERKRHSANDFGFDPGSLPGFLFDFQADLVTRALRKGRFAWLVDCGLGKGPMALVWAMMVAKQTSKPVLILVPLAVAFQMLAEAQRFGIDAARSLAGEITAPVVICNYDRLHYFKPEDFGGVVGDEAACIKNFAGQTTKAVTDFMKKIPYRLLCTATAAPNDYIELGTFSEALGCLGYTDMLTRFFKNDQQTIKPMTYRHSGQNFAQLDDAAKWRFKGHAEIPFWQWVCSWACAVRRPSDLGYSDEGFILPPLIERDHLVHVESLPDGMLFALPAVGLKEQRDERRRSITERCEKVAELVLGHDQSLIWCHLNPEGDLLESLIPDAIQVSGRDSDEEKEKKFIAFATGAAPKLICKPKIGCWGLNLQNCNHVTTFPSHCYDQTTEVLTKDGWKTFDCVLMSDDIATVNQSTLAFEWERPTDIIWDNYCGEMIHFGRNSGARSFDLLVTPNHNMFVQRCPIRHPSSSSEWGLQTADILASNYKRQEYRMLSAPLFFQGMHVNSVAIKERMRIAANSSSSLNKRGDRLGMAPASWRGLDHGRIIQFGQIPINDFLRLAGWYLSEGYCGARFGVLDGQITITQTEINPEHRKEIIELMNRLGFDQVNSETKNIRGCSIQLAEYLVEQFGAGSYNKKIPSWVKDLASDQLMLLRDTMLKGDGCSHVRGGTKWFYRTVSKRLADDFQEICLKTGVRGAVHARNTGACLVWDVNIARENLTPSIHTEPVRVQYDGMIGCVTVPNHTVIVRRNGIPVVSGNSYEQYYQAIRRCWRFGQKNAVTVDIVTTEGEKSVLQNTQRKARAADRMFDNLIREMHHGVSVASQSIFTQQEQIPTWLR